jgi:hypothetical protein
MRSGLLQIAQRNPGIERRSNKCVPERVRADRLGDPGAARHLAGDPPGAMSVQAVPVAGEEDGAVAAFGG